jgi:hypothetical protein
MIALGPDASIVALAMSPYLRKVCDINNQRFREFNYGWISFSLPDTGHWKVDYDQNNGTCILSAGELLPRSISFSMGPMRSQVDSKGYCEMFVDHIKSVFSPLPKLINGAMVTMVGFSELSESPVDGMTFYEWYMMHSFNKQPYTKSICAKQLDIHGMRNEAIPTIGSTHYGFNVTANSPTDAVFEVMLPMFRRIISTVKFAPRAECELMLGKCWDKMGR